MPNINVEEIKLKGNQLVDQIRSIVEEGNARRVIIKKEDRTLLEIPLSVGVGGATAAILLAPTLAAVGAVAALVTDVSLIVERLAKPGSVTTTDVEPTGSASGGPATGTSPTSKTTTPGTGPEVTPKPTEPPPQR